MKLSDKGKALREVLMHIESADLKLKKLTEELLFEFNKKETLVLMLKQLIGDIK